jgi:two-component system OmpR family sensor kinase
MAHQGRGGPRAGLRPWLAARSLRTRLIAGLLCLLALACATVGVVTYTHLHSVLISQLDSELATASQRYGGCVNPPLGGPGPGGGPPGGGGAGQPPQKCAQLQAANAFTAVVTDGSLVRSTYLASDNTRPSVCRLSAAVEAQIARIPVGRIVTVDLQKYGAYRVTAVPGNDGTVLVNGLPLSGVSHTLRQVAEAELAVFLAALLITGVIGTAWVRVSLRPLRRVAATATRVTQMPLSSGEVSLPERVPDANPATEVGQVGAAFNRMLGHVESALARREASESRLRTFAADASHELRTPLSAIRGYAELARRHPGPLPDEVAHALSRVESESARMSELVDELLLLARLDAGRPLASEPVDLTRLVIDVASDASVAAPDHKWQLDLPDEPVVVRGDDLRLHQVLANLLSNAARHTPAGTTVTVALGTGAAPCEGQPGSAAGRTAGSEAGPRAAILHVTDDGPGIPAGLQPTVFERFVRGDGSRSRAAGSSGLGLAIVHAVIAAHGGSAAVVSQPGETRFTVTVPLLAEPGSGPQPGTHPAQNR